MGRTVDQIVGRMADTGRVIARVAEAVGLVIEELDRAVGASQERRGGYFCWTADQPGAPVLVHALVGVVSSAEKSERYLRLSCEKAVRLARLPRHHSSWESRDEQHERYGGAIRAKGAILSFSGFPETADEAAMLLAALKLGGLSWIDACTIANTSNNGFLFAIVALLQRAGCWNDGNWTVPTE
ncbi:hypothetical protein HY478_02405 [Candidatus Uhrbacteria bacterium]|nr:hypothetical protein [Candidatus Uhrbacteria bacterium]